jgi:hypothetical protein
MIHHISISAHDPEHVAAVLAELMDGRVFPFPGRISHSFMAVSGDEHGSMIEVFPETVVMRPGEGDAPVASGHETAPRHGALHVFLSVPVDRAAVERIAQREGWRSGYFGRGFRGKPPTFHVIEVWVENRLMVEIATPEMIDAYLRRMRFERLDADLASPAGASF